CARSHPKRVAYAHPCRREDHPHALRHRLRRRAHAGRNRDGVRPDPRANPPDRSAGAQEIARLRKHEPVAAADGDPVTWRRYFAIRKVSITSPVSDTCFRRNILPSISTTLIECTCEMNLSVKACQLAGSFCCSAL